MRDGNVIEVNDVYKKFKNYFDKSNNLKEKVLHRERNKYQEHWVLQGISFQVKKGEAVGLIGCNGCGKSTTLKLLTKIIYPDKGNIEIKGRVSSLLELGAGFHPDLSGYENIYLNAAVFGLSRKEIDNRVEDIIRFSELREFIDNPIRTYSSGMYMKLAFSVAINVDADILLIDEILGVGDVSFQKKCFEKLMEIKKKGTTIVLVSHSTDQIERICDRSIWIEKGKIRQEGNPNEVHENYLDVMEDRRLIRKQKEEEEKKRIEEEKKRIEEEKKRIEEEKKRKAEEKRKKEERKRFEQERKQKEQKAKEQIEKVNLLGKEQRSQEREELENRKRQRELLRKSLEEEKIIEQEKQQQMQQKFQEREWEEFERQKKLAESAENERRKQQIVQEGFKLEEIPEEEIWVEYYKKETNRLQLVVDEKNLEIERLNSVIRQKDLLMGKNEADLKNEVVRLEKVVTEKEDEADRLNGVIIEKNEEIDRLNVTIMEKDLEIDRINGLLAGSVD